MKLTPEQIEDILSGQTPQSDELDAEDLARLEEARAMRARLRAAFDSTHASDSLADKVRASLKSTPAARGRIIRFPRWILPAAAIAALLLLVPVLFPDIWGPEPAQAATVELANIHKVSLSGRDDFYATGDCEEIKAYFKRKLGFEPKLLSQCPELSIIGCYVARLKGQMVATYVVKLDDTKASIIITEDWPKKLGLGCGCGHPHCKCFHNGQCEDLSIVSVRLGERSYSVVGSLPAESLRVVLERLRG
ncbi:MAG: hypothetical protein QGH60_05370 [Phycisphaerae bacterium]|jgi:hypothetical protein|nr:hypothetical protein [Phycisphaerae bacterium]